MTSMPAFGGLCTRVSTTCCPETGPKAHRFCLACDHYRPRNDAGIPKGPRVKLLYALRTKRYPPRSGDISAMKTFLMSLGLERYCKVFEESEVDMGAVDVMEESDYAQLGVAKVRGPESLPRLCIVTFSFLCVCVCVGRRKLPVDHLVGCFARRGSSKSRNFVLSEALGWRARRRLLVLLARALVRR